jgi:hypothetical protein
VHPQTFCYHPAGSGPALHKVSTLQVQRIPLLLSVAREHPVWLWRLECLKDHTYRVLVGLSGMSPESACPVPVHRICFPRLWSVLPDSQLSLKNLRSLVLTYLRSLQANFPFQMDLLHFMEMPLLHTDQIYLGWDGIPIPTEICRMELVVLQYMKHKNCASTLPGTYHIL